MAHTPTRISRRTVLGAGAGIASFAIGSNAFAAWPDRPITLIVPYPAGGGTDVVARVLAPLMERELKATINVVNRAGGGGITGHEAIQRAQPDGHTIGMISNDLSFYTHLGQSKLTHRDFVKIGQTNEIVGSVTVKADAPWKNVNELLAAIKANPGKMRGTGAAPGVNWHVGFLGMMDSLKMDSRSAIWVPAQGGTLGHQDVASGGSEFSTSSLAEARALLEAQKVRTLCLMGDARAEQFPDIPTLKEATGSDWTFSVVHGMGAPRGLPNEIRDRLSAALTKAHASDEFQTAMKQRTIRAINRQADAWEKVLEAQLNTYGRLLREAGLARG
jgi:tripartite-type tricarboxylate transporter receptor subunit TctC